MSSRTHLLEIKKHLNRTTDVHVVTENEDGALTSPTSEPVTVHAGQVFFAGLQLKSDFFFSLLSAGSSQIFFSEPDLNIYLFFLLLACLQLQIEKRRGKLAGRPARWRSGVCRRLKRAGERCRRWSCGGPWMSNKKIVDERAVKHGRGSL